MKHNTTYFFYTERIQRELSTCLWSFVSNQAAKNKNKRQAIKQHKLVKPVKDFLFLPYIHPVKEKFYILRQSTIWSIKHKFTLDSIFQSRILFIMM